MSVTRLVHEVLVRVRDGKRKRFARVPVEVVAAIMTLKVWSEEYGDPTQDELEELWAILREHV